MKIAIASDERTRLTDTIISDLQKRGHTLTLLGHLSPSTGFSSSLQETDWPLTSSLAAYAVSSGDADEGIVFCWTGTGALIAANKVNGIRAALCNDAETARGARKWNHANVLAISLRSTSEAVAKEILEPWFETTGLEDEWNLVQIGRIRELEERNRKGAQND